MRSKPVQPSASVASLVWLSRGASMERGFLDIRGTACLYDTNPRAMLASFLPRTFMER
jgi:hypothetical protein